MTKTQMKLQQLLAGTQKDLPATSSLNVNGQALKQSDIVSKLQGWIQLLEQKDGAKVAAGTAVDAVKALEQEVTQFRVSFGRALQQFLGEGSQLLADFGLKTPARKVPSSETRTLAVAKGAQTRKARLTLGSVQKQAVKGAPVKSITLAPGAATSVVAGDSQAGSAAGAPVAVNPAPVLPSNSDGVPSPVPIGGGGK